MLRQILRLALLVCVAGLLFLAWDWQRFQRQPLALAEVETYTVPPGQSLAALVAQWRARGWIDPQRDTFYLRLHARRHGLAGRLHVGEFTLRPGISLPAALALIVSGQTRQYAFTIVEGWTFRQLRTALGQAKRLDPLDPDTPDADIMRSLGRAGLHPEGQFFPETYHYTAGGSALEILRRAHRRLTAVLQAQWEARAPGGPLRDPYQALVLASIVEKETGVADERARIAGVFVRRLEKGMRLQTDPTVIYGLGESFDGNLRRRDLTSDTPYNTYTRAGLPPTPIAMAGEAAIHAALHPAIGNALYFVATGDGRHVFSATLAEHNAAVRRYQLRR